MQIQISWLLQKPTDLDLHCLQRQGISWFSRTRVKKVLGFVYYDLILNNWSNKSSIKKINCFAYFLPVTFLSNYVTGSSRSSPIYTISGSTQKLLPKGQSNQTDRPEQRVKTQISCHRMWHLIKISTVCHSVSNLLDIRTRCQMGWFKDRDNKVSQ